MRNAPDPIRACCSGFAACLLLCTAVAAHAQTPPVADEPLPPPPATSEVPPTPQVPPSADGNAPPAQSPTVEVAASPEVEPSAKADAGTERRGGFVIGLIAGPSFGWATGHPSDRALREKPAFETEMGLGFGYRVTPFIGGALTDWFTFGLGSSFGRIANGDYQSGMWTFVFHLEAFPLYEYGGIARDLGLTADFGAGMSSIRKKSPDMEVADSGAMSTVGIGAFWEPVRLWKIAGGPYVGYQRNWSRWFSRNDVTLGIRGMFYGAP